MSGRRENANGAGGGGEGSSSSMKRQREWDVKDGIPKRMAVYDERLNREVARVRSEVRGRDNGLDRKTLNIDPAAAVNSIVHDGSQSRCVDYQYFTT